MFVLPASARLYSFANRTPNQGFIRRCGLCFGQDSWIKLHKSSRPKKSTVIIPMQTEASWFSFICYRCLSESMSSLCCVWQLASLRIPRRGSPLFQEQVYICCLRDKTRTVPTSLKIDYMDSFVSINNSVIPAKKVNLQLQKSAGWKAPEGCRTLAFGCKCFCSLRARVVVFSYQHPHNNLN